MPTSLIIPICNYHLRFMIPIGILDGLDEIYSLPAPDARNAL
jgi:hypothetical protein